MAGLQYFTNALTDVGALTGTERIPLDLAAGGSRWVTPAELSSYVLPVQGGITPGTYGDATHVAQIAVNAEGVLTGVSNVAITGGGGGGGSGNGGALQLISQTVTAGSAGSVTFSTIPSNFQDLILVVNGRTNFASAGDNVAVQFNGDTAAHYTYQVVSGFGVTAGAASGGGPVSSAEIGNLASAGTANYSGSFECLISNYANTTFFKETASFNGYSTGTGTASTGALSWAGSWASTAAINTIKVFPVGGTAFVDGTVVTLYGRGGTNAGVSNYVEFTPTGTGTLTISPTNVPFWNTARDLLIIVRGQSTAAVTNAEVNLQYNGDTGANYANELFIGSGTAMSVFSEVAQIANHTGWLTGASGASSAPGYVEVRVFDINGSTFQKAFLSHSGMRQNTTNTGAFSRQTSGWWQNTAAVTSIILSLSSGNWAPGTVISVQPGVGSGVGGTGLFAQVLSTTPTQISTGLSTWVNQGASTVSNTSVGMQLIQPNSVSGITLLTKPAPATPYKIKTLISNTSFLNTSTNTGPDVGLCFYDGSAKVQLMGLISNSNAWRLEVVNWTNPTTFNAVQVSAVGAMNPCWMRIRDDGTNVFFELSSSGDDNDFTTLYSVAKASGFLGATGYSNVGLVIGGGTKNGTIWSGNILSWTQL